VYFCSHQYAILHLPAKFCSNRTIDGGIMTSYQFFKMAAMESTGASLEHTMSSLEIFA